MRRRSVKARDGGAPGIALVEQGLETALQQLFVVPVMQAMQQPERTTGWRLSESPLKVIQADLAQSQPGHQQ